VTPDGTCAASPLPGHSPDQERDAFVAMKWSLAQREEMHLLWPFQ